MVIVCKLSRVAGLFTTQANGCGFDEDFLRSTTRRRIDDTEFLVGVRGWRFNIACDRHCHSVFGMNTPFPDQQIVIDQLRAAYRDGARAPLLVAPCGFGKTFVFSFVTAGAVQRGSRVLLLAHRDELVDQISGALRDQGVNHGVIAAGWPFQRGRSAYVASVFTMAKRLDWFNPDLVVIDEAHHCTPNTTWGKILAAYPKALRLGVTATPCRLSGEGLADCFDRMILGPTTQQLIDIGRLSPLRVFAPPTINTTNIRKRMGEFIQGDLLNVVDRPTITGKALDHYKQHANDKRTAVFCVSVEHTKHVAEDFRKAGYAAESIDGKLPRDVRRSIIHGFRRGNPLILTSCSLIDEGFDCPSIECGIDLCPTESLGRFRQRTGRLLRTATEKSEAILLDAAGNTLRHGFPTQDPAWTLSGLSKVPDRGDVSFRPRVCVYCFSAQPARNTTCRNCGKPFGVDSRVVSTKKGDLAEMTWEEVEAARLLRIKGDQKTLDVLVQLGRQRGYQNPEGWARHVFEARQLKRKRA